MDMNVDEQKKSLSPAAENSKIFIPLELYNFDDCEENTACVDQVVVHF